MAYTKICLANSREELKKQRQMSLTQCSWPQNVCGLPSRTPNVLGICIFFGKNNRLAKDRQRQVCLAVAAFSRYYDITDEYYKPSQRWWPSVLDDLWQILQSSERQRQVSSVEHSWLWNIFGKYKSRVSDNGSCAESVYEHRGFATGCEFLQLQFKSHKF